MRKFIRYWMIFPIILITLSCSILSSGAAAAEDTIPASPDLPPLPQNTPLVSFRDVPIMPGAFSSEAVGTTYLYQTHATVLEVQVYYLREMPSAGWELEDQSGDANQGETSIRLRYRKGDDSATVFIVQAGEDVVQVTIL